MGDGNKGICYFSKKEEKETIFILYSCVEVRMRLIRVESRGVSVMKKARLDYIQAAINPF